MIKNENSTNLKKIVATVYIGIFCYIIYTFIPIQCPQNNSDDSSVIPEAIDDEKMTPTSYGLNFELIYEVRYII